MPDVVTRRVEAPYGTWPSPITAAKVVEGAAAVSELRHDGVDVWWTEQRPAEGGRTQLVRWSLSGERHDALGPWDPAARRDAWNVRTAVGEYGGGAFAVRAGTVVFANFADQRLYRLEPGDRSEPLPLTPVPTVPRALRHAEPVWLDDRWIVCVRESHEPAVVAEHGQPVDQIVAVPLDGSAVEDPARICVLVEGADFLRSPVVDGDRLAWLRWDHPRMPWDGTELVVAAVERDLDGDPVGVLDARVVAGGPDESIVQPGFVANGDLLWCTDRTGWWNPWRLPAGGGPAEPVLRDGGVDAEIGGPLWVGGLRWWAEIAPGRLLVSIAADGAQGLGVIEADGTLRELDTPFTEVGQIAAVGDRHQAALVGGSPVAEPAPYLVDVVEPGDSWPEASLERLRPVRHLGFGPEWCSVPEPITFPSEGGRQAHALFYPPTSPEATGPAGQHPPLVVTVHGGPTSAARNRLDLGKQFWTSRGFAVVDVDYAGSTGYGRPYRELLDGAWGVADVEDAVAAARSLAEAGRVDGDSLAIRGGSAGGYTVLCALCFHDVFKAGASHYGVADLSALATDTHKFESRYLDRLVGPWPEARATYEARSPIHHTDGFSAPLIVFQGSEDRVVPPNQAEMIVDALASKAIPHAYVLFDGEGHGFRQAEHIVRALEAELWFYGRVFGFAPADPIDPVEGAVGL